MSSARRPGRTEKWLLTLVVLALLAFTLHTVVFSGASFTAESANPATTVVAGSLLHANSRDGGLVLDAAGLVPGDSRAGTMTLTGTGDVGGVFTLTAVSLVDVPAVPRLSDTLRLTVEEVSGPSQTLYQGAVSAFSNAALGLIAPGEVRTYRLALAYPNGTVDAGLFGAGLTLGLLVTGVTP